MHAVGREHIMFAILACAVLAILWSLERKSKDHRSRFSFDELLTEDGKTSKAACLMFGSFAVATWLLVFLTVNGKITEGYFSAYLGFYVAPAVAKIIKGADVTSSATVSTISSSTVVEK
jgi:hypothetical protein